MIKTEISCDTCGRDLKNTSYSYEYFLALENHRKVNNSGICYATGINPSIDSDKHFCGLPCLKLWLNKENCTDDM